MSTIYLVRHGVTSANRENRFAGRGSEGLHDDGAAQIRQVGERLRHMKIDAIFCGPAKRTVESAEIIGSLLEISPSARTEFDEINIPHWEGLTKDEIRRQCGRQYPTWLAAPQDFSLPGCETLQGVQKRAVAGLNSILAGRRDQNILLVSHLIVLRCLVLYFLGLKIDDFRSIEINNGSIIEVSGVEKGGWSLRYLPEMNASQMPSGNG